MSNKEKGSKAERELYDLKSKIHIWDLPLEKIYIKLKNPFRKSFFDGAHQKFGSWEKLGKYMNILRADTLIAKNWKEGLCCCPLSIILGIAKNINISPNTIEKNIEEIKSKTKLDKRGGSSGKSIVNPKLPIKLNGAFAEILGHICGDGSIVRKNLKKGISLKYTNSEPALIEDFQKKIREVFGDIKPNIQIREGYNYTRKNFLLQYPTILSLFILTIFDCKAGDKKNIPEIIFKLPNEEKCLFLRALFDDESSVSVKYKDIKIGLKPQNQIEDVRNLLLNLGFSPSRIFPSGGVKVIKIYRHKDILLFKKLIGFNYPLKKKKLDLIIKNGWKFEGSPHGETKKKIMNFLKNKNNAKTSEITNILKRQVSTTRSHPSKLKKQGLILRIKTKDQDHWRLA